MQILQRNAYTVPTVHVRSNICFVCIVLCSELRCLRLRQSIRYVDGSRKGIGRARERRRIEIKFCSTASCGITASRKDLIWKPSRADDVERGILRQQEAAGGVGGVNIYIYQSPLSKPSPVPFSYTRPKILRLLPAIRHRSWPGTDGRR